MRFNDDLSTDFVCKEELIFAVNIMHAVVVLSVPETTLKIRKTTYTFPGCAKINE